jgi:hypothetical protein
MAVAHSVHRGWLGEIDFAATPAAAYGIVLLAAGLAYLAVQAAIIQLQGEARRLSSRSAAISRETRQRCSTCLGSGWLSSTDGWPVDLPIP